MLPPQLLGILYFLLAPCPTRGGSVFPGRGHKPIDLQVLHAIRRSATGAVGFVKRLSVHTLRHSFGAGLCRRCSGLRSRVACRLWSLPPNVPLPFRLRGCSLG